MVEDAMEILSSSRGVGFELERRPLVVLLPAYNEVNTIVDVVKTYYAEVCKKMHAQLVVAEDGSTDGTREILVSLRSELPIVLMSDHSRKGYAKGVSDALRSCSSDWVFFSDSDGQYFPSDFWNLWTQRNGCDMIVGCKVHRREAAHRIVLARGFHKIVNGLFGLSLHDADCGFRLIRKDVIRSVVDEVKFLEYSFWAEFTIRACLMKKLQGDRIGTGWHLGFLVSWFCQFLGFSNIESKYCICAKEPVAIRKESVVQLNGNPI